MCIDHGRVVFSLAIVAIGVETVVCARDAGNPLGPGYSAISVIPWVPAIPGVAYAFGAIWIACGLGILFQRTLRPAAMTLAGLLALCTLVIIVLKSAAKPGDRGLRTVTFEPLAMACFAWLLTGRAALARYLLALTLIVFGVDHFLALRPIGSLIPGWIPWHVFWVAFFGGVLVAGGLSIAVDLLRGWGAAGVALTFGIWVITLHLPRVLGLYGIAGAPRSPDEWSSLFIAMALWGGAWALASVEEASQIPGGKAFGNF
jgi:uncharacterized membrane protein